MAGSTITSYKYALSTSADNVTYSSYGSYVTSSWTSGTTFTITGLTNGTYYKVKVRAVNAFGDGTESAELGAFKPFAVPSTPAAPTVSLGTAATTIDTFTWIAPAANGDAITKYGYQTSTDDGATWSAETEQAGLTKGIETAYTTSSYKLRARAFNGAGWGSYSLKSTGGTGAWSSEGAAVAHPTACAVPSCSCAACGACTANCDSCGTSTITGSPGTSTHSGQTNTRTCYRWTRSGNTSSGYSYNQNSTAGCDSAYTGCTGGSCSACTAGTCGCSSCGTWNNVTSNYGSYPSSFTFAGVEWAVEYSSTFGQNTAWVYDNSGYSYQGVFCGSGSSNNGFAAHLLYTCSVTGAQRIVYIGCSQ